MPAAHSPLLTDTSVFEAFVRKLPRRGFLMATGLEQAFLYLEIPAFAADEAFAYPVEIGASLRDLAHRFDRV